MKRLATPKDAQHELNDNRKMSPLLLLYTSGIAAVYKGNWIYLRSITVDVLIKSLHKSKRIMVLEEITKHHLFNYQALNLDYHDPIVQYLKIAIRPLFSTYIPIDSEFQEAFDLFEMILALITFDKIDFWIEHNAVLRNYARFEQAGYIIDFWAKGASLGKEWGFLREFFGGSRVQLEEALNKYHEAAMQNQHWSPKHNIPDYASIYKNAFM